MAKNKLRVLMLILIIVGLSVGLGCTGASPLQVDLPATDGGSSDDGDHSNDTPTVDPCAPVAGKIVSGTKTIIESYNEGQGSAQFDPTLSSCWKTHRSSFAFMQSSDIRAEFVTETIGGVSQNARKLTIDYRDGMNTNAGVNYSPFSTPDTGWDSGQFPYIIDLFKDPQCYTEVTVTAQVKPINAGTDGVLFGLVLNGNITGEGATRKITGYFIHINGGGNSGTLVKFENAFDHAFDYIDHFPGYNLPPLQPNPLTDGPYKGWDFHNTAWPAGGSTNMTAQKTVAARYRYNSSDQTVTIDWEVRPVDGSDATPASWDKSRTLSGADALAPGGGYGIYSSFYGAIGPGATTSNATVLGEFKLVCTN